MKNSNEAIALTPEEQMLLDYRPYSVYSVLQGRNDFETFGEMIENALNNAARNGAHMVGAFMATPNQFRAIFVNPPPMMPTQQQKEPVDGDDAAAELSN